MRYVDHLKAHPVVVLSLCILLAGCSEPTKPTLGNLSVNTTSLQYLTTDTIHVVLVNGSNETLSFLHCIGKISSILEVQDSSSWKAFAVLPICLGDLGDPIPAPTINPNESKSVEFQVRAFAILPPFEFGTYRVGYRYWDREDTQHVVYSNGFSVVP